MNFLFSLFFLFNLVSSYRRTELSFVNIIGFPTFKQDGNDFIFDFLIQVNKDISDSDINDVTSKEFKFSILPPSGLKFIEEVNPLKLKSVIEDGKIPDNFPPLLTKPGKIPTEDKIGKCDISEALNIVKKLETKAGSALGIYTKKNLKSTISEVPKINTFVVDITSEDHKSSLKRGYYTWSGKFKLRDSMTDFGNLLPFGEFVIALTSGKLSKSDEDAFCFSDSPSASAIMINHLDTKDRKIYSCGSYYTEPPYINEFEVPYTYNLDVTGDFKYDKSKKSGYFDLSFQLNDSKMGEVYDKYQAQLNIELPKELKNDDLKGIYLCTSKFTPAINHLTCKYDNETRTLRYSVLRSYLKPKQKYTLKLDMANSFLNSLEEFDKSFVFNVSLTVEGNRPLTVLPDYVGNEIIKAAGYLSPNCTVPLLYLYDVKKGMKPKMHYLAKSKGTLKLSDGNVIMYGIKKYENFYVMKLFIRDDKSLWTKKNVLKLESPKLESYVFNHPVMYSESKFNLFANVDNIKYGSGSIEYNFVSNRGNVLTPNNKFHELNIPFILKKGDPNNLNHPEFWTIKITDEKGIETNKSTVIQKDVPSVEAVREYVNKDTTIKGPYFFKLNNMVKIQFKLKMKSPKTILTHLKVNEIVRDLPFEGNFFDFNSQKIQSKTDGKTYIQFLTEYDGKTEDTVSKIELEFNVDDIKKFSIKNIDISVVADPTTTDNFDITKEKTILISDTINTHNLDKSIEESICVTKDTRFSSSRFRLGDNANYLFFRLVNCKNPWLKPINYTTSKLIDVSVLPKYNVTPTVRLQETLGAGDYDNNKVTKMLIDGKRFYEHTLYLLFDETAISAIKDQYIKLSKCVKSDATCSDTDSLPIVKKFIGDLFSRNDKYFTNVVVSYHDKKNLYIYRAIDINKKIDFVKPKIMSYDSKVESMFDNVLNIAIANSSPDIMGSSFSVVAVVDEKSVLTLKSKLSKYTQSHLESNNGVVPHSILVDVIPVDSESTIEVLTKDCHDDINTLHTAPKVDIKNVEEKLNDFEFESEYYTDFMFTGEPKNQPDIEKLGETTSLKGKEIEEKKSTDYRKMYKIFFGFNDKIYKKCTIDKNVMTTIQNRVERSLEISKLSIPSYHVVGTCTSFGSEKNGKRPQTYTLSYRDIKLGEYEILAKEDITEKLYGECDLDSLYKYMPDTPHFVEVKKSREPTLPDKIRSNEVKNGIQIIKYDTPIDKEKIRIEEFWKGVWDDVNKPSQIKKEEKKQPKISEDVKQFWEGVWDDVNKPGKKTIKKEVKKFWEGVWNDVK